MSHLTRFALSLALSLLGFSFALLTPKTHGDWETAGSDPFAKTYAVHVYEAETDSSGKCSQLVAMAGHGVFDQSELPCDTEIDLILATDDKMLVGDRYFSNTPKSLIVVNEDHTCMERTYEISGEDVNVDGEDVTTEECRKLRKNIKTELTEMAQASGDDATKKIVTGKIDQIFSDVSDVNSTKERVAITNDNGMQVTGSQNNNLNDGSTRSNDKGEDDNIEREKKGYSVKISKPFLNKNGTLVKYVTIESSVYRDVIEMPSFDKSHVITSESKMLVGETLYSDKPDQLVIVTGPNSCSLREYGADREIRSTQMSYRRCLRVQQEMREMAYQTSGSSVGGLRNRMGSLGNQMVDRFGNLISGIMDVGTKLSSDIGINSRTINHPSTTVGLINQNLPQQSSQHRQSYQNQVEHAGRTSGILAPLLTEMSNPLLQLFNNIGDARRVSVGSGAGQTVGMGLQTFSSASSAIPQTNRRTPYSNQQGAAGQQGQINLFRVLNPLAWVN